MTELRIVFRAIVYNHTTFSIILVRNRDQKWWYAPGGNWDYTQETIMECLKREVLEETGIHINITKLLYTQTLYIKKQDNIQLEQFWLAEPFGDTKVSQEHTDKFGIVDEARWFCQTEMQTITVYPEILKNKFWCAVSGFVKEQNRYIGHFIL